MCGKEKGGDHNKTDKNSTWFLRRRIMNELNITWSSFKFDEPLKSNPNLDWVASQYLDAKGKNLLLKRLGLIAWI